MLPMEEALSKYKVVVKYPVHWGDMDAARHVNNLVYLRWSESARIAYFAAMQLNTSFSPEEIGPILGWQDCKYIFPITFPDIAIVGVRVKELLTDRFILESAVFSEKHQRIACISKQSIIPYDYGELKKVELPTVWLERIRQIDTF